MTRTAENGLPTARAVVSTSDGIDLAVYESGASDSRAAVVLCVHGFPDDHHVWDGVLAALGPTFRVVTFDTRGSGRSGRPRKISAYRLDQLADDINRVIAAVSPERPVHLVGHDWGSVQAWHMATDPGHERRIASLTSISGPCLDHVPFWIRARLAAGPGGWRDVLGLWKSPIYMGFFQLPWIAPLACRLGLIDRVIAAANRFESGDTPGGDRAHRARENRRALKIYTANLLPRLIRPQQRATTIPVQVLAPRRDIFITYASQVDVGRWADDLTVHALDGGHWVPAFNPDAVADLVRAFARQHEPAPISNGAHR